MDVIWGSFAIAFFEGYPEIFHVGKAGELGGLLGGVIAGAQQIFGVAEAQFQNGLQGRLSGIDPVHSAKIHLADITHLGNIGNFQALVIFPLKIVYSLFNNLEFSIDVKSNNGDNALSGKQGLQIRDIVLQIMCDAEMDLGK